MIEWGKLIDSFSQYYYTPILMFFVETIALIIAFIYARKTKIGKVFIFYISFDYCFLIIDSFLISLSTISQNFINEFGRYSNNLIALTELLVYFYFFYIILPHNKARIVLKTLALLFLIVIICFIITRFSFLSNRFGYISSLVGAIEFILLLPPCFFYFYRVLKVNPEINLFERPTFWIVTGILFYSLISIPYYLLTKYLTENYKHLVYTFHAALYIIPFTLNFVFLIKAFLCKKTLTI